MIGKSFIRRHGTMIAMCLCVVVWYLMDDPDDGKQLMLQLQTIVGVMVVAPLVYYLRRFFTEARSLDAANKAINENNIGAGLVFVGLCILTGLLFIALVPRALADPLPGMAAQDLPILKMEIQNRWKTMPMPSMLAAQVEQESGWKRDATLKTSREEGVGYGQFTRAYGINGSLRFDALSEVSRMDKSLSGWTWADRYNPRMQLRAVVVKNRECFGRMMRLVDDDYNALAMCDSAYNGGEGGLMADRRLCAASYPVCDPRVWFGHVEHTSMKSRKKWHGYGASAFDINRTHVRNVMTVRRQKYIGVMGG